MSISTECANLQYCDHSADFKCAGIIEELQEVWAGDDTGHDTVQSQYSW